MLCTMNDVLKDAKEKGYGVGAFNFHNQDILEAIIAAAEEVNAPVIAMITPPYIQNLGLEVVAVMGKALAGKAKVPVVLHFDHGNSFELAMKCLANGFSSVMFDGSKLPFEENMRITKQVADVCRAVGASLEGELGAIGGVEDGMQGSSGNLVIPEEAQIFVEKTGVDVLAPSIGTAHGIYKSEPVLDYDRLAKVRALTDCYLALHGGSGLTEEQFKKMIAIGINKVNVGTELKLGWSNTAKKMMESGIMEPSKIRNQCLADVKEIVKGKIKIFGSENRA
ncbi:MAG: class II fructose-bisphosphate aldolase [Dehalobacterium sp.]